MSTLNSLLQYYSVNHTGDLPALLNLNAFSLLKSADHSHNHGSTAV